MIESLRITFLILVASAWFVFLCTLIGNAIVNHAYNKKSELIGKVLKAVSDTAEKFSKRRDSQ